jgi:hypothetical protein
MNLEVTDISKHYRWTEIKMLFKEEVFYSTQYDMYDRLKKDLYVIEKDQYVRIRRLRLILYNWFF